MEEERRRKEERRLAKLDGNASGSGDDDLLGIAVRYGYGSTEAFGRAFRAVHGASVPVSGLTLDASVGHVKTDYKTFLFRDPTTNVVSDVASIARPIYAPSWTARAGGEYAASWGDATVRFRADYSFRTKMYFNALDITAPFNNAIFAPNDHNVKARVSVEGLKLGGSSLELGLWGDNLTNQRQRVYGIDFGSIGFAGATFKKPTTWGVDARIRY